VLVLPEAVQVHVVPDTGDNPFAAYAYAGSGNLGGSAVHIGVSAEKVNGVTNAVQWQPVGAAEYLYLAQVVGGGGVLQGYYMIQVEEIEILETQGCTVFAGGAGAGVVCRSGQLPRFLVFYLYLGDQFCVGFTALKLEAHLAAGVLVGSLQVLGYPGNIWCNPCFKSRQRSENILFAVILIAINQNLFYHRLKEVDYHRSPLQFLLGQYGRNHGKTTLPAGSFNGVHGLLKGSEILLSA